MSYDDPKLRFRSLPEGIPRIIDSYLYDPIMRFRYLPEGIPRTIDSYLSGPGFSLMSSDPLRGDHPRMPLSRAHVPKTLQRLKAKWLYQYLIDNMLTTEQEWEAMEDPEFDWEVPFGSRVIQVFGLEHEHDIYLDISRDNFNDYVFSITARNNDFKEKLKQFLNKNFKQLRYRDTGNAFYNIRVPGENVTVEDDVMLPDQVQVQVVVSPHEMPVYRNVIIDLLAFIFGSLSSPAFVRRFYKSANVYDLYKVADGTVELVERHTEVPMRILPIAGGRKSRQSRQRSKSRSKSTRQRSKHTLKKK